MRGLAGRPKKTAANAVKGRNGGLGKCAESLMPRWNGTPKAQAAHRRSILNWPRKDLDADGTGEIDCD
jgi:hypothetical protein